MRILHVFETIPGGPATYLNETIPFQLEQFGVENVRILAPAVHLTHIKNIPETCVASFNRTGRYSSLPALAVEVHRQVKRFRPQIIHAHSTFAGVIVRSLGAVSPNFPPIIYCPHGWVFDMDTLGVFRRPARWTERLLSSFCHKIVAISQHEYRQGIEAGVSPDRMVVIENGIAAEAPRFEPTAWKDDRTKVLFIGRLDRQKGVDILLRAAALLRDKAVFKIIGAHVTNKSLSPRDVSDNVEFLGWKSPQEISSYLAVCDVVAMPSRWEGFGLVALEAMRSSKPVIASAVGGLQSVVSDGETGHLVPAGNHEALAATIIAHDKSGWAAMGAAGYQRFMARYTSDRTSRELMALYRDVIHRSHASQKALA